MAKREKKKLSLRSTGTGKRTPKRFQKNRSRRQHRNKRKLYTGVHGVQQEKKKKNQEETPEFVARIWGRKITRTGPTVGGGPRTESHTNKRRERERETGPWTAAMGERTERTTKMQRRGNVAIAPVAVPVVDPNRRGRKGMPTGRTAKKRSKEEQGPKDRILERFRKKPR